MLKTIVKFYDCFLYIYAYHIINKDGKDVKQSCLDIENKINDSISPQPDYTLEIQNNDQTIKLIVKSGLQKPYLYKSKAYKRNDTVTIEVDTLEFSRLILDGKNIRFEELPCRDQNLTFDVLHRKLAESIQIFAGGFLRLLFFCFIQIIRVLVSIADCDRLNRMTICTTPLTILWHTNTI